ncbi:MAG TPA: galactokinase [Pyrinomonadaceae bacterium]|nr:galactokinase [Pyrinomonadaceae bacterium]
MTPNIDIMASTPRTFRAPGRVNLIGEHTDYNEGFVMPVAIGFSTYVTVAPGSERKLSLFSENFAEQIEFDLDDPNLRATRHWSDYPLGVAVTLERAGYRLGDGASLRIHGEVPIGSGLSSSAAIEVATCYALLGNLGLTITPVEIAKLCQRAENEFVGMRCGIMDQFVSCCGHAGQALMLDCRSLEFELLPLPPDARLVICNTMVSHSLAAAEYNTRRAECEAGVRHFSESLPNVRALRDVTYAELKRSGGDLSAVIYRRCRHIITENTRVVEAAACLQQGDLAGFGRLMNESHVSLRDDYEVSCKELDLMVERAQEFDGVYGARMTGGGFGGCTVNLVAAEKVEEFKRFVSQGYTAATGLLPEIYVSSAAEGAEEVTAD